MATISKRCESSTIDSRTMAMHDRHGQPLSRKYDHHHDFKVTMANHDQALHTHAEPCSTITWSPSSPCSLLLQFGERQAGGQLIQGQSRPQRGKQGSASWWFHCGWWLLLMVDNHGKSWGIITVGNGSWFTIVVSNVEAWAILVDNHGQWGLVMANNSGQLLWYQRVMMV